MLIAFSSIFSVILSIEAFLTLKGESLCRTLSCEVVANYITIGQPLLVTLGAIFFFILTALLFFSTRYPKYLNTIITLLLFTALTFDAGIIGFQVFTIKEKCALCIVVAGVLWLITTIHCSRKNSAIILFFAVMAWIGSFSSQSILTIPEPVDARQRMIFYSQEGKNTAISSTTVKATLIFSMNCPHCFEVISFLSDKDTENISWNLATVDTDKDSLEKVQHFLSLERKERDLFKNLLQAKSQDYPPLPPLQLAEPSATRQHGEKAFSFLKVMGLNAVPVLIFQDQSHQQIIASGSRSIINFLQTKIVLPLKPSS